MNTRLPLAAAALPAVLALFTSTSAPADDGHDHGPSPAAAAAPAAPRFAGSSARHEVVGVVDGRHVTVYVDRFDDNTPVADAAVELAIGSATVPLDRHETGNFEGLLAEAPKPGHHPVTARVVVGGQSEVITGEIDVSADAPAGAAHGGEGRSIVGWAAGAAGAAGAAALLAAVAAGRWRRRFVSRRVGGAA